MGICAAAPEFRLRLHRLVVEWTLFDGKDGKVYRGFLMAGTSARGTTLDGDLAAANIEVGGGHRRAARLRGWTVPTLLRKPGDLVFHHQMVAPVGHVEILLTRDILIANVDRSSRESEPHPVHSTAVGVEGAGVVVVNARWTAYCWLTQCGASPDPGPSRLVRRACKLLGHPG